MIDINIVGEDLPAETAIWRYMDLAKFLDLVTTQQIVLPLASLMEDPFEGDIGRATSTHRWLTEKGRGAPSYWLVHDQDLQRRTADRLRGATYISCWNALQYESAAMWKLYGDNRGIAIRSTWGALCDSLAYDGPDTVFGGAVRYVDYETEAVNTTSFTDDYFFKRQSFSFEHEIRLVTHAPDVEDYLHGSVDSRTRTPVIRFDANLTALEAKIYINPSLGSWVRNAVEGVSRALGFQWDVRQSTLYNSRDSNYWPK